MRILIAEDNSLERLLLQSAVESLGHECVVAKDGAEAWSIFEAEEFDVVVSDWLMPEMEGLELCRRIRAQVDVPYTYVIILTSLADRRHAIAGMQAGADDYLVKPLDIDDLTARLGAAERMMAVQRRLVAAERAKDELISVVSHELRTPLSSLVGFAQLMLRRDFGRTKQVEFLTMMVNEGRRLAALINDSLDLQRMDGGHQKVVPVPVAIDTLLRRAASTWVADSARPLLVEVPDGLPDVAVDEDRIVQVLLNIIGNAHKFSPEGGKITLAARAVEGEIEISVTDLGLGIPPEALPRLFEWFYRVDTAERQQIKGTGLGLAISKSIVGAHRGRLWAKSAGPGQGSTLTFTLPIVDVLVRAGD